MSIEENKALCRGCIDLWNDRDSETAGKNYAEDFAYHGPPGELRGREAIKGLWATFLIGFPDMHSTIDHMVAEDDRVVVRRTIRGTHTGLFNGIEPTGNSVTVPVLEELRIADGVLAEAWDSFDQLGLMQQIGAAPATSAAYAEPAAATTPQGIKENES